MELFHFADDTYEFVIDNKDITYSDKGYYKIRLTREELEGLYHEIREHIIYN